MNPEISASLQHAIKELLGPHLERCPRRRFNFPDDEIELLVREEEESNALTVVIRMTVIDESKEIHISNIFMPTFMRHQGIGKTLIGKIYEVAKAHGYSLFLVQMTEAFFNRMVKRNATIIEDGDCVQITDETNLKSNF